MECVDKETWALARCASLAVNEGVGCFRIEGLEVAASSDKNCSKRRARNFIIFMRTVWRAARSTAIT